MPIEVTSNIQSVLARLKQRKQGLEDYTIVASNKKQYAAAVDQGWTRLIIWSELTRRQRYAIIHAMKNRKKKPRWAGDKGFRVVRGGKKGQRWVRIVVPPEGIIAKSTKPILQHIEHVLARRPLDRQAAEEIAAGMKNKLVENTPKDEGLLAGAWEAQVL